MMMKKSAVVTVVTTADALGKGTKQTCSSGLSKDKPVKSLGSLPLLDPLPKAYKSKYQSEPSSLLRTTHAPINLCHPFFQSLEDNPEPLDHIWDTRIANVAIRDVTPVLLLRKVEATLKSAWTEKDQIDNLLKERRLMRSLERFVSGRPYGGDSTHRFNTTAGNPVKKILLKLNLSDHRLSKDGGVDDVLQVKEFQRSFRHSDTERLSQSDEVLKLKNFKKYATLKLFKSTNQVRYEHVGQTITSSQDGKVNKMAKLTRLCLVDDLKVFKITYSHTSQDKEQAQA
ncbi:hypothetical protein Tco_1525112 [Tanacetum coccineum]